MIVMTAVENRMGTLFNNRRLSRDREWVRDMQAYLAGRTLHLSPYSAGLFRGTEAALSVSEDFLDTAQAGEICLTEGQALAPYADRIEEVVLYRWMRDYPFDRQLDLDLTEFTLAERVEFAGFSHETIVREVYRR